jgi:hypothetical protein
MNNVNDYVQQKWINVRNDGIPLQQFTINSQQLVCVYMCVWLIKKPMAKGLSNSCTGWDWPWGFKEVEAPRFHDNWHMKVVRLSALSTSCLYPTGNIPGLTFVRGWVNPRAIVQLEGLSMKNSYDTIRNRTRDLLAYSTVPQPTMPPHAPTYGKNHLHISTALIQSYYCWIMTHGRKLS